MEKKNKLKYCVLSIPGIDGIHPRVNVDLGGVIHNSDSAVSGDSASGVLSSTYILSSIGSTHIRDHERVNVVHVHFCFHSSFFQVKLDFCILMVPCHLCCSLHLPWCSPFITNLALISIT